MSRGVRSRGGRKTRCLWVLSCAAAGAVVALLSAGIADADEAGYLDDLSRHGYLVTAPTGEYLLGSGHAMCRELTPGIRRTTWPSIGLTRTRRIENLLDMATAAQNNLCDDD